MKYITSLKKDEKRTNTYLVYFEVDDTDIEALESLAFFVGKGKEKEKLDKWLVKAFKEFQKVWRTHD